MQEWERESPRQPQPTPQGALELVLLFRLVLRGAQMLDLHQSKGVGQPGKGLCDLGPCRSVQLRQLLS